MTPRPVLVALAAWLLVAPAPTSAHAGAAGSQTAKPPERRVFLLGLRQRGDSLRFATLVSNPASPSYRRFLTPSAFRARFSPRRAVVRRVRRYLASQRGGREVELSSDRSLV